MSTLFDLTAGLAQKEAGVEQAAVSRAELLDRARVSAKVLAGQRERYGVTSDDVRERLSWLGYPDALGNAAGSIFRGKEWEFTGEWRQSKIPSNHGRMIRVWRLK